MKSIRVGIDLAKNVFQVHGHSTDSIKPSRPQILSLVLPDTDQPLCAQLCRECDWQTHTLVSHQVWQLLSHGRGRWFNPSIAHHIFQ